MADVFELPRTKIGFAIGRDNPHGLRLTLRWDDGEVSCRFTLPDEKSGYPGIAHGGVLAAVLDETMGWAPSVAKRRMCVAAELTFRYLTPAPVGVPLTATARMTADKLRLFAAEGTIAGEDGTVYVKGKGLFMPLSAAESARIEAEILIYPDGVGPLFS